jgi:tRNA nucleotidyltransferase (CCA-adding enzyme)
VGIKFGTVGVFDPTGRMHEVTTFRRDLETDGRHAVVHFGASLDEDLARRDFTINAIAYSPSRDVIHDPFDGQGDIRRRLLRTVGEASERMTEDRLRALRAIRFATRFAFEIEPTTWEAMRDSAPHLGRLSPERVRQELEKTMEQVGRPSEAMRLWEASGAFATLIPALVGTSPVLRKALDHLAMPGPPRRPRRRLNRLTALFLGIDAEQLPDVLQDLRFSNSDAAMIAELVRHWQSLSAEMETALLESGGVTPRRGREWASRTGRLGLAPLLRLSYAVWCARRDADLPSPDPARVRSAYRMLDRIAYRDPIGIADLAVDGEDLIRAGIPAGPRLGIILRGLLSIVIEDPTRNTHSELIAAALELTRSSMDPVKEH